MGTRRRRLVVFSALGTTLDAGGGATRWNRWRPTIALCQQEDLLVDRLELLVPTRHRALGRSIADDIAHVSPETRVVTHEQTVRDPWDFEQVYGALLDLVKGYPFDPAREEYLVHITTGTHVMQICFFLLAESRLLPAKLIQTSPGRAKDGVGRHDIIDLDLERYDELRRRFERERDEGLAFLKGGVATRNARFNALIDELEHVASRTRDPILLMGPTGAGKSQLARRIHELSRRSRPELGAWVEVNCATLRGDGAMSALFGHTKGAFTGAASERAGLLRQAHGGMLFLDEIGELGLDEQAMLLHALEEKRFRPMGSDREIEVDFQLLCGTNRDLRERARRGEFRDDLLARIDTWTFALPGLAQRPEDIEPNLDLELERASERVGRVVSMNAEARARYLAFATSRRATWPGNFRDLTASVRRMATLARGERIDEAVVTREIARLEEAWAPAIRAPEPGLTERLLGARAKELDRFDHVQLEDVLSVCAQSASLSEAGRTLFAQSRERKASSNDADRLRKYLARFELTFDAVRAHAQS